MDWEQNVKDKFQAMTLKIPVFHRHITEVAVIKKAEENALARDSRRVEEQDVINAFFSEVPPAFYSMMVRLLEQAGFEYRKYGFPKNTDY